MKSSGVFIGEDGSMGLRNGYKYEFTIKTDDRYIWLVFDSLFGSWFGKSIPYATMRALLKNWKFN